MKATISKLYLLLGRELEELSEVKAGNIVGIGGLENYILKSATISSNVACTPFVEITQSAAPILRVAVEPELSSDLKALVSGLHLLNQADANVQVLIHSDIDHGHLYTGQLCHHFVFRQVDIMGGNTWDPNYARDWIFWTTFFLI